ncbi:hypothetical protein [Aquibium microcysteis]|uniref:hypothetical protein n=1 Tax=Aquibium microcysteis TaxID=675281 RepID=UPI00165D05F1|nr:hypothetical protein [Aquibium microcysteis]
MSDGLQSAPAIRGGLRRGAPLPSVGLMLALCLASPAGAASILGADGADGTDGSGTVVGAGGDGAGNPGSGGAPMTNAAPAGAGASGTAGTGGGGGGGGRDLIFVSPTIVPANGAAGGNGEFGSGGAGGTITAAAGGGGAEAGGGGGFGASSSGSAGGGGGGGGGRGLTILGTDGVVAIGDTVTGGSGGDGGSGSTGLYADGGAGGGGGIGVVFGGDGVFLVEGSIAGGDGGDGGDGGYAGSGGAGGTGLRVSQGGVTVQVDGTVSGGAGGTRGASSYVPTKSVDGPGGAGIVGADLTIVLGPDGSISGGLGGDGLTRADAVTFTGGANGFELQAQTSSVVGTVAANGTDDVFRLGGTGTRSFDAALIGTQYGGFERFEKVGGGTWTLTGTPGVATAWSVTDGTLALPGEMAADIATTGPGTFALQGGTLDGTLDNGGTTFGHGEITGATGNAGTFHLDGDLVAGGLITNDGLFTAAGSGAAGSFSVRGGAGFVHGGTISLSQAGGIAGDVLDLTGAGLFQGGADSELVLDIDLSSSAAASDQLLLGDSSGQLALRFDPDPARYGALTAGLRVVQTADGALQATATGLQDRGLVSYALEQIGTDWYVTSRLDAAPLGGIVAGLQSVQRLTDAAFGAMTSGSAGACAAGIYGSVHGGTQAVAAATSAGDGGDARSDVTVNHGGARFDVSSGCLDIGRGDATIRFGLVGGLDTGTARYRQALAGDTTLTSTTGFTTGYLGLQARLRAGGLVADGRFGYDATGFDVTAGIAGGPGAVIDGQETRAQRLTAAGSVGYVFRFADVTLTPSAGLSLSHAWTGPIRLANLGGRLDFADRDAATVFGGVELAATAALGDGRGTLRAFAAAMLSEDFGGAHSYTYGDDVGGATTLKTAIGSTSATLSAGVVYAGTGGASVGIRGELSFSGGETGAGVALRAEVGF